MNHQKESDATPTMGDAAEENFAPASVIESAELGDRIQLFDAIGADGIREAAELFGFPAPNGLAGASNFTAWLDDLTKRYRSHEVAEVETHRSAFEAQWGAELDERYGWKDYWSRVDETMADLDAWHAETDEAVTDEEYAEMLAQDISELDRYKPEHSADNPRERHARGGAEYEAAFAAHLLEHGEIPARSDWLAGQDLEASARQWRAVRDDTDLFAQGDKGRAIRKAAERERDGDGGTDTGARAVIEHTLSRYELGLTTDGEPFAVAKEGVRLPTMLGTKGGALRNLVTGELYDEDGLIIGDKALTDAFRIILAKASRVTVPTRLHLRCATEDNRIVIDLGHQNSTRCIIITPNGWTVSDMPPEGILFRRTGATQPLPEPTHGGSLDVLREVLGFAADDQRWLLVRGWLVASVLSDIPRPLLMPLGTAGAGKTVRGHAIINVWDPRDQLGSSFGRSLDDDQVKALGRYMVGYDNLTSISEAVSDHVCRLVTGDSAEKRRNYTDTEQVVISYRRTGVCTAITLPALRADALERIIPIHLDELQASERMSERLITRRLVEAHPSILGAVCDGVVKMLRTMPDLIDQDPDGPRMKDFWLALLAYDPACATAYEQSLETVMVDAANDDPFVVAVRDWVQASMPEPSGQAEWLLVEFKKYVNGPNGPGAGQWLPKSGRHFSNQLTRATNPLRAIGVVAERERTKKARTITLRYTDAEG